MAFGECYRFCFFFWGGGIPEFSTPVLKADCMNGLDMKMYLVYI